MSRSSQPSDLRARLRTHLRAGARLRERLIESCLEDVLSVGSLVAERLSAGGKLLLCGNGGSAADCQHLATELTGRYQRERPGLAALALTTDGAFLTAYSNDYDFEGVFERQVEALGRPGDVLLGISTSGESGNVLRAVLKAREMGLLTVGLCGSGGLLRGMADFVLAVPSRDTALIQECHLALEHSLALVVEELLHGATGRPVQATTLTEVG